jgi:hypothetical protein
VTAAKAGKRKRRTARLVAVVLLVLLASAYSILTYVPVQKAIYPDDLGKYDNVIVIQYGLGAPTDYVMIGDSTGLFEKSSEKKVPVNLQGSVPPWGKPEIQYGTHSSRAITKYICFVNYNGLQPVYDQGLIDTYTVTDWAPLAPINRHDAPAWLMPKGYTCLWDVLL